MKNLRFIVAGFLTSLIIFSGCNWISGQDNEAAKAVQDAVNNLADVKSASYQFNVKGDFAEQLGEDADEEEISNQEKISIDLKLDGAYDFKDLKAPKFLAKISFTADPNGKASLSPQSGSGEMRLIGGIFYFVLSNLSDFDGELPKALIEPYIGKWQSIVLPEEISKEIAFFGDETNMTPEQKEMRELFEKTMFYKNVKFIGDEKLGDTDVSKYQAELDNDALIAYMKETAKITGAGMKDQDLDEFKKQLDEMSFSGEVFIGKEDKTLHQFIGNVSVANSDIAEGSFELEVSYFIDNLNGEIKVDAPEGAAEFNPMALLGL